MEVKELFQHALAIKKYCNSTPDCAYCPLKHKICVDYNDIDPVDWTIPKEYWKEEEK